MSTCRPCSTTTRCDPSRESLLSTLNNFILSFYGAVLKSCVNGQVVWTLPCNLDAGLPGYPRLPNEGLACYFLRIFDSFGLVASGAWSCGTQYHKNAFVTFNGAAYVALGDTLCNQPDISPAFWQLYVAQGPPGPPGSSPLTTKGDIFGYDVADARVPVGADNTALMADSTQALGVRWGFPPSSDLAANLGAGDGVFAFKAGNIFQFKSLIAGTNITITPTGTDLTISMTGGSGSITENFTSTQQTITSSGPLTLAHGLTGKPTLFQCSLVNLIAEGGFNPGDEVFIGCDSLQPSTNNGMAVWPDATNINIMFASAANVFQLVDATTGNAFNATNANWELVVRAWR